MPLTSDLSIDYVNGILSYVGGFTDGIPDTTYSMNELYSYLMDVFDEPAQMDDANPMRAPTPTDYKILYPWFMDPTSVKAFYGGALESEGWAKVGTEDTSTIGGFGITKLLHGGTPTEGGDGYTDKGVVLTGGTSGATGEILWADNANNVIWVRNTSSTQFDDATPESITGTGWSVTLISATGVESGENLWSNLYTIAQIRDFTDIYIIQDDVKLTEWWDDGSIDVLVLVQEAGSLIDSGIVTVLARQQTSLYDFFQPDLSNGGRNPAPLSTAIDANNSTGSRTIATGVHSGAFEVGELIVGGTSGARAILTAYVTDTSLTYALVDKNLTDFQSGEVITGQTSTETATSSGSPADSGPATWTNVTLAFGAISRDLNNGNGSRPYSIEIDCNTRVLTQVYERLKYITRRGSTTQIGVTGSQEDGEQYLGSEVRLKTTTPAPSGFTEGGTLTQTGGVGDGATGIIVAYHSSPEDIVILSNVRGTFTDDSTSISDGANSGDIDSGGVTSAINGAFKSAPFGTFAGGTFFGAPGVYVTDLDAGDIQAYQLIDDLGVTQQPPNEIAVSISGLAAGDRAGIFRRASSTGPIEKDRYQGTAQSPGATTIVVGTSISSDEPAAGVVKIIDVSEDNDPEALLRYTSWTGSTFTLATAVSGTATAGSSGNALEDTGADFGVTDDVRVGDTIRNTTTSAWGYIVSIDGVNDLTTVSAEGQTLTWSTGNGYETNTLPFTSTVSDNVYVPFVLQAATGASVSNTFIYSADVYGR
ncbi:MAG: hypothetical protein AMS20_00230 [Gemmatimonas sp. SG8_28]|nr:MAG: hypothetical protein AMS20_00230 [Gemmatimonas sp. SG8_28]